MAKIVILERANSSNRIALLIVVFLSIACGQTASRPTLKISEYSGSMVGWGIQGDVKEAQSWVDSGDSTVLVVSEIQKGELYGKGYVSEVFGYHFIKQGGKWKSSYSIKEANQSPNEIVHYHKGSIQVKDVDGRGGAETIFFYSVAMDGGTEPLVLKMIFHWNGIKAPIRGKAPTLCC